MSEIPTEAPGGWWQRLRSRFRRVGWRKSLAVAAMASVVLTATVLLWPMEAARYLRCEASSEMRDRDGRLLYAFVSADEQWCFPRALDEVSPYLIRATIATEDKRFPRHYGVDLLAVARATQANLSQGRVVSGASTLTMQVVKQPHGRARSLWGKALQAIRAVRLELRASKDEILAAYLNNAPYGQNLVGCEAASRRYFGKPSIELTLPEAALLAGLPQSPNALSPLRHPERALTRRGHVLDRMLDEGTISSNEHRRARLASLGVSRHALPQLAPHMAMRLRPAIEARRALDTTIDEGVQRMAEDSVAAAANSLDGANAAAIVVDVKTATVLARVGSAGFFDASGGQVDATRARRSPGSTLKPFVYALAMDAQRLYACETLLDGPLDYGLLCPENFDLAYRGHVSASDALRDSLNIPAVVVLERVGYERAWTFLRRIGLTTLTEPPEHYGLGLTLGSCEARLDELAAAYRMIANLGEYRPLRETASEEAPTAQRCLSRGAALKTLQALERPMPGEIDHDELASASLASRVAWKTGTSSGRRDAWTFALNAQYVVGVWIGRNDGASSEDLIGSMVAAPLARYLLRTMPSTNEATWPTQDNSLKPISICALSGLPKSDWCRATRVEHLPREQYLHRVCDVHYPGPNNRVLTRWPGSARGWDLADVSATFLRNAVTRPSSVTALRILEPINKAEFILTGASKGDRVRLRSSLDSRRPLHWYLDDRYLGESKPEAPLLLDLTAGQHALTCITLDGAMDQVKFLVAKP